MSAYIKTELTSTVVEVESNKTLSPFLDLFTVQKCKNTNAITIVVPKDTENSKFRYTEIKFILSGGGDVEILAQSGVTLIKSGASGNSHTISGLNTFACLTWVEADKFHLFEIKEAIAQNPNPTPTNPQDKIIRYSSQEPALEDRSKILWYETDNLGFSVNDQPWIWDGSRWISSLTQLGVFGGNNDSKVNLFNKDLLVKKFSYNLYPTNGVVTKILLNGVQHSINPPVNQYSGISGEVTLSSPQLIEDSLVNLEARDSNDNVISSYISVNLIGYQIR